MLKTSTYDFRNNLANYLSTIVKDGSPFVIEKYNQPLAIVFPYDPKLLNINFDNFYGFLTKKSTGFNRRSIKEKRYINRLRHS